MQRKIKQHTKPCNDCPFRRQSLPGWLGDNGLEDFIILAVSDIKMPCHLTPGNGAAPNCELHPEASQCAGRAIFLSNMCKSPRDSSVLKLPADRETVFSRPQEFVEHHGLGEMHIVVGNSYPFSVERK